jgi:hypothetical protein
MASERHSGPSGKRDEARETRGIVDRIIGLVTPRVAPLSDSPAASAPHPDPLKNSALYRLKRDSLYIVAKMNEGKGSPGLDAFKRQIVFVQSQLVLAAIRDPELPVETKAALVGFQEASLRETIEDRRGIKRRACVDVAKQAANEPRLAAV